VIQQLDAELPLQELHALGQRGRGHLQPRGGTLKVLPLDQHDAAADSNEVEAHGRYATR